MKEDRRLAKLPRLIILSPHLDDGILSSGGLIPCLNYHFRVEVWTVFSGAPWWGPYSATAQWLHGVSGGATGSRLASLRRREDREACRMLGASWRHFRGHDAVYRRGHDKKILYENCCQDSWDCADEPLIRGISDGLRRYLKSDDVLLVPLAIGGHVDHRIVRHAAEQLNICPIIYYEDVPYVQRFAAEASSLASTLSPLPYAVCESRADLWVRAVQAYRSQMLMLEGAVGSLRTLITDFAASGKTSLWIPGHGGAASDGIASALRSAGAGGV